MHTFRPDSTFPRAAGVLLPITALPDPHGIGCLGPGAFAFVGFLAKAGVSYWQMLPAVPPGPGFSPYSTTSAFALSPWISDVEFLHRAGLISKDDLDHPPFPLDAVDYDAALAFRKPCIEKAAWHVVDHPRHSLAQALEQFRAENSWVEDYATFTALKAETHGAPWWTWPAELRHRQPAALDAVCRRLRRPREMIMAQQLFADLAWKMLRTQCEDLVVRIIGDVPIYVDADSVDVWCRPDQFLLDDAGQPRELAGAPPDDFSPVGQLWGNPVYDWDAMQADGFAFWRARLRRMLELVDVVRIDHFRGFSAFWSVPREAEDARGGRFVPAPGHALFAALKEELGTLPIIAEDLGVIDDDVVKLRDDVGLPGMTVLQFAFGEDSLHPYLPHNHHRNQVVVTGTHDTSTLRGYWNQAPEPIRDHMRRYLGVDGLDITWDLIRAALSSVAHTAVLPMQDLLDLDDGARMNVPGRAHGNWRWRMRSEALHEGLAERLGGLLTLYDRDELKRLQLRARRHPPPSDQSKAS